MVLPDNIGTVAKIAIALLTVILEVVKLIIAKLNGVEKSS